jgi:hypothetical protein
VEPKQPFKKSRAKQPLRKVVPKMFGSTFFERWTVDLELKFLLDNFEEYKEIIASNNHKIIKS